jgi:hypothetical protein
VPATLAHPAAHPDALADPKSGVTPAYNAAALAMLGVESAAGRAARARVAIGFVDYGFDLLHPTLRAAGGATSRFRHLWDQNRTPDLARTTRFDPAMVADWQGCDLDRAVARFAMSGSRRALDEVYDPHANNCGRHGTIGGAHGTLIASMAAGTPYAGFRGAAPAADLIGVQLALADHDWQEQDATGQPTWDGWNAEREPSWTGWRSYDAAPQIGNAVRYLYDRGCRLGVDALVINLSIGAWAGAHDGRSPVETTIGEIIAQADHAWRRGLGPRTIVVAGAGNAGADEGHWHGMVTQRAYPTDSSPVAVTLTLPDGVPFALAPGRTHEIVATGTRIGIAEHGCAGRGNLSCVRLLIHPQRLPARLFDGAATTCSFRVHLARDASGATPVHAWIERDDGALERSWLSPSHAAGSLCCLATIPGALVVAGYDHWAAVATGDTGVMPASSLGPAPWLGDHDGSLPHVAAPGHDIWGARSKSRGFAQTTGTSAAVALVSGAIAHHLGIAGAGVRLPRGNRPWSPRFGHGPFHLDPPGPTTQSGVAA